MNVENLDSFDARDFDGTPASIGHAAGAQMPSGAGRSLAERLALVHTTVDEIIANPVDYVDPDASTAITGATETQANFDTGIYPVEAARLAVGSVIRVRARGKYTGTTGAETVQFGIAWGATVLCISGNIDPANNDVFELDAEFVVRSIGATGTVVGSGVCRSGTPASATMVNHMLATGSGATSTTTINTLPATDLTVFADRQAGATDADSLRLDSFAVEIRG